MGGDTAFWRCRAFKDAIAGICSLSKEEVKTLTAALDPGACLPRRCVLAASAVLDKGVDESGTDPAAAAL